jgi:hypothetical protein
MRLAQTRAAVDEERVVCLARILGHSPTGRGGQSVGLTYHEVVEREPLIQLEGRHFFSC